jgi:hypothetical protein
MDTLERARLYVGKMDPSYQGQNGNGKLFAAALAIAWGFAFDEDQAVEFLLDEFNPNCIPEWSEKEIRGVVRQALAKGAEGKPRGFLLNGNGKHVSNGNGHHQPPKATIGIEARKRASGLTPELRAELAAALGLPEAPLERVELLGWGAWGDLGGAWTYPERNGRGEIIGVMRRFEKPINEEGDNKLSVRGSKRGLVLPRGWNEPAGGPLFVTEGFSDCLALLAAGHQAIARPQKCAAVDPMLAEALARCAHQHVVILADGDDAGPKGKAAELAGKLAAALPGKTVQSADPPAGAKDAREWLTGRHPETDWPDRGRDFLDALKLIDATAPEAKKDDAGRWRFEPLTSRQLKDGNFKPRWLIQRLLVAGQLGCVGGSWKTLKTSIVADLAISLGSATPFLGRFDVYRKARVAILSGESGTFTLQETAKRICKARDIDLADVDVLWQCDLPQLGDVGDLAALADGLKAAGVEVVIIDPLYLCLLTGQSAGPDAMKNVYAVGPLLMAFARACLGAGCTPIIVHHASRQLAPGEPMELSHLSGAGPAEFARQWLLLNRREAYRGDGRHVLWLNAGGSCGQGGLWQVAVDEGRLSDDFSGRTWGVEVTDAPQAFAAEAEQKDRQRNDRQEERLAKDLEAAEEAIRKLSLAGPPHAATKNKLRDELKWGPDRVSRSVHHLLGARRIEERKVVVPFGSDHTRTKPATGYVISGPVLFPSDPSDGNNERIDGNPGGDG